ncbi:MAG: HNH endonuclease [Bacilli bacterium]|nr:HNH endonuclease [Bacilli bacterium]
MIKKRCEQLKLSTSHFSQTKAANNNNTKYKLEDILIENSTYKNISRLKERLVKEGKLEYKCAICGNTGEWNKKILILQLDHINGKHNDHRLINLRFLCPNCHSQTENFSGRNKNKDNTELNQ